MYIRGGSAHIQLDFNLLTKLDILVGTDRLRASPYNSSLNKQ